MKPLMKLVGIAAITGILLYPMFTFTVAAQPEPPSVQNVLERPVHEQPVSNEKALIRGSDLIVLGRFDTAFQEFPLQVAAGTGKLVNYVQMLQVSRTFKGNSDTLSYAY